MLLSLVMSISFKGLAIRSTPVYVLGMEANFSGKIDLGDNKSIQYQVVIDAEDYQQTLDAFKAAAKAFGDAMKGVSVKSYKAFVPNNG